MTKRIFRSIFTVAAVILLASFVLITGVLYEYFSNKQVDQLNMQTHLAAQGLEAAGEDYLSDMDISGCRLTWIAADGTVLYDSQAEQSGMENHADREEIRQALQTGRGESARYSATLLEKTLSEAEKYAEIAQFYDRLANAQGEITRDMLCEITDADARAALLGED